jgi:hypothetical protein
LTTQGHVAHAEAVEIAQEADVVFDGVSAFDAQQGGELVLAVGALDVFDAEGHHHAVGMAGGLFVDGIDEIERVAGVVAFVASGSTQMEKNSAPRLPAFALSRLMWPESLGSVDPMS